MPNKVTYGLEKVHIAFKDTEVKQVETATVVGTVSTAGNAEVVVTAKGMNGSPKTIPVAVALSDNASAVAGKIRTVLTNDADVSAFFDVSGATDKVILTVKDAAANDTTMNISIDNDTCAGLTTAATSANTTAGVSTWKTPVAVPGAVRFTPTAEGQSSTFYADDVPYFTITSNNGYTAELEMALVPDAVLAEMLGWRIDSNGMLIEVADGVSKEFALLGQILGDYKNRRFIYYQCVASRPEKEHSTKGESVEPTTDVLKLTITPIEIDEEKVVRGVMELSDSNAAAYNNFFSAVTLPVAAA